MPHLSAFTKPICRFLIHRYMGDYLLTELTTNQLEVSLADGKALVQNVNLNTEYINEILEPVGIVTLTHSFAQEISVHVPWKKLLSDSAIIKIKGLELTCIPQKEFNLNNTQDLVSSMIGSIANSMDLARSVIIDEQIANGVEKAGLDYFSTIIDQVVLRTKVIFQNTIIRLESRSKSKFFTCFEIHIDRLEFVDEQLEADQSLSNNETVTEQPTSFYTVGDLNKLIYIKGVRFYTDICAPEKEQCTSFLNETDDNFQSCYSQLDNQKKASDKIFSKEFTQQIQIAEFFSEKNTVRIRINNLDLLSQRSNANNKRIDIDIFVGGPLYFFITPSLITLFKDLFSRLLPKKISNSTLSKPMQREHFDLIREKLNTETLYKANSNGLIDKMQNWSGQELFHEIPFNSENSTYPDIKISKTNLKNNVPINVKEDKLLYICTATLKAPTLIGVITYDDPLDYDHIKLRKENTDWEKIKGAVEEMHKQSSNFFKHAADIKIVRDRLDCQRHLFDHLYGKDHLRIVASGVVFSVTLIKEPSNNKISQHSLSIRSSLEEFDFIECLRTFSLVDFNKQKLNYFDLLNLSNEKKNSSKNVISLKLFNLTDHPNEYQIEINMENCKTELDLSILDRMSKLLVLRPLFFTFNNPKQNIFNSTEISENFLYESINSLPPSTYSVKFYSSKWTFNLRVPVANFLTSDYRVKNVYPEYLELIVKGALLEMPKFLPADLVNNGNLFLICQSLNCSLIGEAKFLNCKKEDLTFLHADSSLNKEMEVEKLVKVKLHYDIRNKDLRKNNTLLDDMFSSQSNKNVMMDSIYPMKNEENLQGPFSQKREYYGNLRLIMPGNRKELIDFSEEHRAFTNFNIEFSVPYLNLCMPSKMFYEVLYNRLANDLALWEPKSPLLKNLSGKQDDKIFLECKAYRPILNESEYYEDTYDQHSSLNNEMNKNNTALSHLFSLSITVDKAKFLLQTESSIPKEEKFTTQIGIEFSNTEMFLIYGYDQNPNLSYLYFISAHSFLFHRNLLKDTLSFYSNVLDVEKFASRQKEDIHLEPTPCTEPCSVTNQDNISIALKIDIDLKTNIKNILLAFTLQDTMVHIKPFTNLNLYWANQFSNFFDVENYEVPGYVLPKFKMDLNLHLENILLAYDHSSIISNSPMQLRFALGTVHINAGVMAEMKRYKFTCLIQDSKFFMRKKNKKSVKFNNNMDKSTSQACPFVKVLFVGLLHFTLDYTVNNENQLLIGPEHELSCISNGIEIWVCADTIVELGNIFSEIINSELGKTLLSKKSPINKNEIFTNETGNNITQNIKTDDQDSLERMLAAAMEENPEMDVLVKAAKKYRQHKKSLEQNSFCDSAESEHESDTSLSYLGDNQDNEFVIIYTPPKKGATRYTAFKPDEDYEFVEKVLVSSENHENNITENDENQPIPSVKYTFKDISLTIYLFGGNDFGDVPESKKLYSQWINKRNQPGERTEYDSEGGKFRDHTVCVETQISNISFVWQEFNGTSPINSFSLLKIHDIVITDHLKISRINKLFYQFKDSDMPRKNNTPLFSIYLVEDHKLEKRLKISIMPIRLNFDQDTVVFLLDFYNNVSQQVQISIMPGDEIADNLPILEVNDNSKLQEIVQNEFLNIPTEESSMKNNQSSVSFSNNANTILFSAQSLNENDSLLCDRDYLKDSNNTNVPSEEPIYSNNDSLKASSSNYVSPSKETFYKEFVFYPDCQIRLDYNAKRVQTEQGAIFGMLAGLADLKGTKLVLKKLHNEKGMLGINKCIEYAVNEWTNDIKNGQFVSVISSFKPLSSFVSLGKGCHDLFAHPFGEFRRENGRVMRGIQQGVSSFGFSTVTATIDFTHTMVTLLQSAAELAFDLVNPDYQRQQMLEIRQPVAVPGDIREGLNMAYDTIREGVMDAACTLQSAARRERNIGNNWAFRGILRHATPTFIRPFVFVTEATGHVLGGLKNQLKPDDHKEELEKWRRTSNSLKNKSLPSPSQQPRSYEPPPAKSGSMRRY